MIPSSSKTYRNLPENSVVLIQYKYVSCHPVVHMVKVNQTSPKNLCYGLTSQTNSQNALFRSKMSDHFFCNTCLIWNSRPGRNYNFVIFTHIFQADLIIPVDIYTPLAQLF